MLPNFVVIGAQKAGTTSLWRLLDSHPRVFMSPVKETDFFVAEKGWNRGIAWYESLFEPARSTGAIAVGEASPNYTLYPGFAGVPERMSRVIPDARLVYVLRHPVERMVSGYLEALTHGSETLPIERALTERRHYADQSRYATQIERYLRCFDCSRLLILLYEELEQQPARTLERLLAFLGVPGGIGGIGEVELGRRENVTADKRVPRWWWRKLGGLMVSGRIPSFPVPASLQTSALTTRRLRSEDLTLPEPLRRELERQLRPDIERLRSHLGEEFDCWGLA